ncbi:MAG TPA: hypothetical protein VNO52_05490, partial [Methylomirabilota bacterium]|nr:hypothetical protein [Methylomirabilota bacterium]
MNRHIDSAWIENARPNVSPALDPEFRPAVLARRAFRRMAGSTAVPVGLALERSDGSVSRFDTVALPADHPDAEANFTHLERLV